MIIFGWGFQTTKDYGVVLKNRCGHCNNEEYWLLTRTITWFTLFFIPVIPYSIKYRLSCPICEYGLALDNEQVSVFRPIAETNQLLIEGKISEDEHNRRISQINSGPSQPAPQEVVEVKELASSGQVLNYCAHCGTGLTKEVKFCGNCGNKNSNVL